MNKVVINVLILLIVGALYLWSAILLYTIWTSLPETIAVSWLINGYVTDYSSKWYFLLKIIAIDLFTFAMLFGLTIYAVYSKKEYVTFHSRYFGSYRIKSKDVPSFLGILVIIVMTTVNMYVADVVTFNKSRTFFFFTFPFIAIYFIGIFVLFAVTLKKYVPTQQ
ncbi:MAG: hypothetical protein ACP6IS_08670 [Candidatus Asgardarchaeia archaeon]